MDPQSGTIDLTAECLCKAHRFSTRISLSELPLEGTVCHCESCRHVTGALHVAELGLTWPREAADITGLQRYRFSANITYLFCGKCSTLLFYESRKCPDKLGVFSGPLKNIDADLTKFTKHSFVGDTVDGGASVWFRKPNADGKAIPRFQRYEENSEAIPWDWLQPSGSTGVEGKQKQESIPIWCHCKGIKLRLHCGNYSSMAREELPWFIDDRTNKSLASFDVCDSCRLHFGADIVHWTFADLANISQADGGPFPKTMAELKAAVDAGDSAVGTLTYYQSSPDVQRYFCKVCFASAFYACDDRPNIVDVAIGLLEAPDGARAEGFLSWTFGDTPEWVDDTKGGWREGLMKRVQADAEDFRVAKGYPKSWRRLEKEAKAGLS